MDLQFDEWEHQNISILNAFKTHDYNKLEFLLQNRKLTHVEIGELFHIAITRRDYKNVLYIIENINGDVNIAYYNGLPLIMACTTGDLDMVKLLIDKGADPGGYYNFNTPLIEAISFKYIPIASFLLKTGKSNPNFVNRKLQTAIYIAIQSDYVDCVKLLIPYSKLDIIDFYNETPLMYSDNEEISKLLLQSPSSQPEFTTCMGENAILLANNKNVVSLLLDYNSNETQMKTNGTNILENLDLINDNELINKIFDKVGVGSLVFLIKNHSKDSEELLKEYIQFQQHIFLYELLYKDYLGDTCLIATVKNKYLHPIFIMLLNAPELHQFINIQNNWGKTALHYAVIFNHVNAVQQLLKYKANPYLFDNDYNTPANYITSNSNLQIKQAFSKYPNNHIIPNLVITNITFKNYIKNYTTLYSNIVSDLNGINTDIYEYTKPSFNFILEQQIYIQNLTPIQQELVSFYSHNGDVLTNAYLRKGLDLNDAKTVLQRNFDIIKNYLKFKNINVIQIRALSNTEIYSLLSEIISIIKTTIQKAPKLDKNIVVYRGVENVIKRKDNKYETLGLLSTTINYYNSRDFGKYIFHIIIPKGVSCLWMSPLSQYPVEEELLFPYNLCFNIIHKINEFETIISYKNDSGCPIEYRSIF